MKPYYEEDGVQLYLGDCRRVLAEMANETVQCCVTSPPYYGLRDYGCEGQIGMEKTYREYIEKMVNVFSDVRRVLRSDGTLWLNMGDSYGSGNRESNDQVSDNKGKRGTTNLRPQMSGGIKPKDLMMIPHRLAIAMQDDGWYVRMDNVWHKPNPMPESVSDRPTKSHEYIFLMSKSERYFYDSEAIMEKSSYGTHSRLPGNKSHKGTTAYENGDGHHRTKAGLVVYAERVRKMAKAGSGVKNNTSFDAAMAIMPESRNKRSVWTVPTQCYPEAHFATFPENLIVPCIKAGCPPGGLVLDPFGGSGTTGLVAKRLGCRATLIELSEEYANLAVKRLSQGMLDLQA